MVNNEEAREQSRHPDKSAQSEFVFISSALWSFEWDTQMQLAGGNSAGKTSAQECLPLHRCWLLQKLSKENSVLFPAPALDQPPVGKLVYFPLEHGVVL